MEPPGEYDFRDSFEHSSTESQMTSHTQVTETVRGMEEWSRPSSVEHTPHTAIATLQPSTPHTRRFSFLRTFVPSFLFVSISLILTIVLVFETDWTTLRSIKRKPEMVSLHYHYYNPLKEYLKKKVIELF